MTSNLTKFAELVMKDPEGLESAIEKLAEASAARQEERLEKIATRIIGEINKATEISTYAADRLSGLFTKFAAEAHQSQAPVDPGPPTNEGGGDNLDNIPNEDYDRETITGQEITAAVRHALESGDGGASTAVGIAETAAQAASGPTHAGMACRTVATELVSAANKGLISKEVAEEALNGVKELEENVDAIVAR